MPRKQRGRRSGAYLVFVSHATKDKWLATTLCEKIEDRGACTFRDDRDIEGGDHISDSIRRKIIEANELLVLLTPESVDRPWVLFEAGAKWGRRRDARVISVLCHVGFDRIPEIIDTKRAYDLNDFDAYLELLDRRVQGKSR